MKTVKKVENLKMIAAEIYKTCDKTKSIPLHTSKEIEGGKPVTQWNN